MVEDPIIYQDTKDDRELDLRPDGVDCIPVLGMSSFKSIRPGPEYHIHVGCMEFCLCLKGNLMFDSCGREYPFLPGHVFVSSPDEPHHLRNNPSGLKTYRILFTIPSSNQRILGLDLKESAWLVHALTHMPERLFAASARIRMAFELLFTLYDTERRGTPQRRVRMKSAALELLVALVDAAGQTPSKPSRAIDELATRIFTHPEGDYPLDVVAREVGMSTSTFSEAFKRAMGLPLHAYLLNCRVNRAKEILDMTDRSVASIAQELRFYSAQHLAKVFKRTVGLSPAAYRRQN
ncbi:MAG: helix-turn-helix domain-containing protein [Kiritimatiellia bacterium]